MNNDVKATLGLCASILIIIGLTLLFSGCISQRLPNQLSTDNIIDITLSDLIITIQSYNNSKPLVLNIIGDSNSVRIFKQVNISKIQITGSNNILYLSSSHRFQLEDNGKGNQILYYD
jgi:hypothetical protein